MTFDINSKKFEEKARSIDAEIHSVQPRFTQKMNQFGSFMGWQSVAELEIPSYGPGQAAKMRNEILSSFWKVEPHIAGVVNSVVNLDKNRGWDLVGPKRQVNRYRDILLHNVEGNRGWRQFASMQSQSYWTTDIGYVAEVEREGDGGPMRNLYHVDPTRCYFTGSWETPLSYTPINGREQYWYESDYIQSASLPDIRERYAGLGYCALSRSVEVIKVLYMIYQHDQEMLGARAPKGLLLLHNVSEDQWQQALKLRTVELDSLDRKYFSGVMTLASSGLDQIQAQLIALSQLPVGFDPEGFTALSMFAIALCFGYDPSQFWPVQSGALGRGRETEIQHREATAKGGLDWALSYQREIQSVLPPTISFSMEQRNVEGEKMDADLNNTHAKMVSLLYETGLKQGYPLLGKTIMEARQRALVMLADRGVISPDWADIENESQASDMGNNEYREKYMDDYRVREGLKCFPTETVSVCHVKGDGTCRTIDIYKPKQKTLTRGITFSSKSVVGVLGRKSVVREFRVKAESIIKEFQADVITLYSAIAQFSSVVKTTYRTIADSALLEYGQVEDVDVDGYIAKQVGYVNNLFEHEITKETSPDARADLWVNALRGFFNYIVLTSDKDRMLIWNLGNNLRQCVKCVELNAETLTAGEWLERGLIPSFPESKTDCNGWQCDCHFTTLTGKQVAI